MSAEELLDARADLAAGRLDVRIEPGTFKMAEYQRLLADNADDIAAFRARQSAAFAAERAAWERAGEFEPRDDAAAAPTPSRPIAPAGGSVVEAPMTASVWKVDAETGRRGRTGTPLLVLEAMKTEMHVTAAGCRRGGRRAGGARATRSPPAGPLVVLGPPG